MLRWVLIFLVLSMVAGALNLGNVSFISAEIARIIFIVFLVLLVGSFIMFLMGRSKLP